MKTIASFGGGTNSAAMLIGMIERKEPAPDAILFADTGGEKPHTYEFLNTFSEFLETNRYPRVMVVKATGKTLEQDCLDRKALPSVAYGFKTCSQRWKIEPQERFCRHMFPDQKITKLIGFDADEQRRAQYEDDVYIRRYPLIEWDWGREECVEAIQRAGLPLPGKSSCFFCPNMRRGEVRGLKLQYPELFKRAIAMEKQAMLTGLVGLGRQWAWEFYDKQTDMFDDKCSVEMPCGCYDG